MPLLRSHVTVAVVLVLAACAPSPAGPASEVPPATTGPDHTPNDPIAVASPPASTSSTPAPSTAIPPVVASNEAPKPAGAGDAAPPDAGKVDTIGEALSLGARLTLIDAVVGTGREVQEGDHVSVHCVGTLQDGKVFESSRAKKRPLQFVAGGNAVVMGLSEGVVGMRVGGRRTLTVPPSLGYGRRGFGTKVPPSATLVYDVEVLSAKP